MRKRRRVSRKVSHQGEITMRIKKKGNLNCPLILIFIATLRDKSNAQHGKKIVEFLMECSITNYTSSLANLIGFLLKTSASSTSDLTMGLNVSDAPDPVDIKRKLLNVSSFS